MPEYNQRPRSNASDVTGVAGTVAAQKRRAVFLAGSAFTGAFALIMVANPQSALAACVVNPADTVTCGTTATTNTTVNDAPANAAVNFTHRSYTFDDGNVSASVQTGAVVSRRGLDIGANQLNATLSFTNNGAISLTDNANTNNGSLRDNGVQVPAGSGAAVLNLSANGGLITYSGNGSVTNNFVTNSPLFGGIGITNLGAGGVVFGTAGTPVIPNYSGGQFGLSISTQNGNQSIVLDNGTVTATAAAGNGIQLNSTTGTIDITTTDGNRILAGNPGGSAGDGIIAQSQSGNVSITSASQIGTALNPFFQMAR